MTDKSWWYWHGEVVKFILMTLVGLVTLIGGIFLGLLFASANSLKYNCDLQHRPTLYVTMMTNSDSYAYNPQGFCATLKKHMAEDR
jgi:hypothetical protein